MAHQLAFDDHILKLQVIIDGQPEIAPAFDGLPDLCFKAAGSTPCLTRNFVAFDQICATILVGGNFKWLEALLDIFIII